MMTQNAKRSARLETRIAPDTLSLARRAAEMQGRSLSDFVATAIRDAACRTIEEENVIRLSAEGQRRFAEMLIDPPEPSPGLIRAFETHRRLTGES